VCQRSAVRATGQRELDRRFPLEEDRRRLEPRDRDRPRLDDEPELRPRDDDERPRLDDRERERPRLRERFDEERFERFEPDRDEDRERADDDRPRDDERERPRELDERRLRDREELDPRRLRDRPPDREPRLGTLPPSRRASERPIAIACLRLVTFLPDRPDRSDPRLRSCMAFSTFCEAFLPYLRPPELRWAKGHLLTHGACKSWTGKPEWHPGCSSSRTDRALRMESAAVPRREPRRASRVSRSAFEKGQP
jgi:hypothetical protein